MMEGVYVCVCRGGVGGDSFFNKGGGVPYSEEQILVVRNFGYPVDFNHVRRKFAG